MRQSIDFSKFKNILLIDNEVILHDEYGAFDGLIKYDLKKKGIKVNVIDNARNRLQEVGAALKTCDCLLFASTFLYAHEVRKVGELLKYLTPGSTVIGYYTRGTDSRSIYDNIIEVFDEKNIRIFDQFEAYELVEHYFEHKNDMFEKIDFKPLIAEWDLKIEMRKNKYFMPTGRKVLIKRVEMFSSEADLLKEGMIVDELDCWHIDNQPYRGIWVAGKTEPIKLLNSFGANEWEFVDADALAITIEVFSAIELYDSSLFSKFVTWLATSIKSTSTTDIDLIIDKLINQERRSNRSKIGMILNRYKKSKRVENMKELQKGLKEMLIKQADFLPKQEEIDRKAKEQAEEYGTTYKTRKKSKLHKELEADLLTCTDVEKMFA